MKHFIYKTTHPTGKYYIGSHSTININDGYCGSGKWVRSIKDKSVLLVEIIEYADTFDQLLVLEKQYLTDVIGKINNMNFNNNSVGFASGELNWSRTDIGRKLKSLRKLNLSLSDEHGPEKAAQIKAKMSAARIGHKTNLPAWNTGLTKYTSDSVAKLANSLKGTAPWNKGKQTGIQTFTGEKHTDATINHLKKVQQANRINNRTTCDYCGKNLDNANYARYHGKNCKLNQ